MLGEIGENALQKYNKNILTKWKKYIIFSLEKYGNMFNCREDINNKKIERYV